MHEVAALRICCCSLALASLFALAGCGGGNSPGDAPTKEGDQPEAAESSNTSEETGAPEPSAAPKEIKPDDVWFDSPLKIAQDKTALGPASGAPAAAPANAAPPAAAPKEAPTTAADAKPAGGGWETLISGEVIASEVKQVRLQLKDSLATVSKYNGNYKDTIQMGGAVLAALAGLIPNHPENVSWKADAKFVRDLAADIQIKAKGLGNEHYDPTLKTWEQLDGLLSGNKPPNLPEAASTIPFSEVVRRGPAMKRMQRAFDALNSAKASADALKKEQDKVLHETAVLATLTRVIGTEGYESADEEEYKGFVKAMEQACQEASTAAKGGDFDAFDSAMGRIKKACDECHNSYRFGT